MIVNYIYNNFGKAEYAIIPNNIWLIFLDFLIEKKIDIETPIKNETNNFSPKDYYGILSNLNLDIEHELKEMRAEWTRTF